MLDFIATTLRENVELAIFLTLGIGYWIGNLRIGKVELGSVTGVLLAGILIGQLQIDISAEIKSVFFIMFIFAVGYGVGPQFVRGVASDGLPQALFAVVISLLCLICVYVAVRVQGYDVGYAVGLLAGSQTISAAIGLGTDAINELGLPPEQTQALLGHIPVAYAVVYMWGTIGTGLILSVLGPRILGIDLASECKRYEQEMSAGAPPTSGVSAWRQIEMRAFVINDRGEFPIGLTIGALESDQSEAQAFVHGLRRAGELVEIDDDVMLQAGDVIAVSARRDAIVGVGSTNREVDDREMLDIPAEEVEVVVTNKDIANRTISDLAGEDFAHGVYLKNIARGATSESVPILPLTELHRGDIVTIEGARKDTDRVIEAVGYADRPTDATDIIWVGLAIAVGGLIGAIVVPVAGVPITLSTAGGALIAGIVLGWLRGVYPVFGRVAGGALWMMKSVGLNVFIAVVGITSGPTFIEGLKDAGVSIFFWGVFCTSVPMLLAPLIGKYIFRFDPAINLGCCGGARTSTASPAMIADAAKSEVPMLGYAVPYAVSCTLLTLGGMFIVLMLA